MLSIKQSHLSSSPVHLIAQPLEDSDELSSKQSKTLLSLNKVNIRYKSNRKCIIKNIDLDLKAGEMIALAGPSGLGKSTLFKAIIGDPYIDVSGDIDLLGKNLNDTSHIEHRKLCQSIAYIQQSFNIIERLSVLDNVLSGAYDRLNTFKIIARSFPQELVNEALQCLEKVAMADKATELCQSLSGGQRQRVAIARVMMQKAKLVLADEPIASLDPLNADIVFNHLNQLKTQDIAICIILHQPSFIERCDRKIDIRDFSLLHQIY